MKKYSVTYHETYEENYEVEANSPEEAEEILRERILSGQPVLFRHDNLEECLPHGTSQHDHAQHLHGLL